MADLSLTRASDAQVWDYVYANGAVVITKDEDFSNRAADAPPSVAVVWVRVGNTTRRQLLAWFVPLIPQVVTMIENGEHLIELR